MRPASQHHSSSPEARRVLLTIVPIFVLLATLCPASAQLPSNWTSAAGFRYRELTVRPSSRVHLTEVPASETGLTFRSDVPEEKGIENSIRLAGTGVAAGDVDGDGWCDLFFASMGGKGALYRNLGGWRFQNITDAAGVACEGQDSTGCVFADVDGDGDLDLLVNSIGGGTRLFLNGGKGHFHEALNSGLLRKHGSISLALADVDGNGTLDLYVANYAKTKIEDRPNTKVQARMVNGRPAITALDGVPITSPELTNRYFIDADHVIRELGEPDLVYLNDGHGNFQQVPWTTGSFADEQGSTLTRPPYDWGLSVMFRDLNGDLAPDIYVCNDLFTPDRIWMNDGHGRFRAMSNLALRHTSLFSMGIDFADINRDGYDDFLVVDMLSRRLSEQKVQITGVKPVVLPIGAIDNRPQYKRNTLFLNRGDATFVEIGQLSGIEASGWSWSPVFLDVDLDGFEDLLITTGYYRDALNADAIGRMKTVQGKRKLSDQQFRDLKKIFPVLPQKNQLFRNRGDLTFEEKSHEWGFEDFGISQAMCLADLDNDGDLDVVVVRQNGPVAIYRNETAAPRVAVRLKGKAPNTQGIGAKIKFFGGPVTQSQEMMCGGRYLCEDDTLRVFAASGLANDARIEVLWRNGSRSVVSGVRPNRVYEIEQGAPGQRQNETPRPQPLFADASGLLDHQHIDEEFDDFALQPALSLKLSQLGPGVAWHDLDGDGWEDLLIGSGKGGPIAFYRNTGRGTFERVLDTVINQPTTRDHTTVLPFRTRAGESIVLAGLANYEDGLTNGAMVRMFDLARKTVTEEIPAERSSIGPLALADIDGDGELDLVIGGRVIPGRYPEAASSFIFHWRGGQFALDADNAARLSKIGLVSGATFSDLDGDGWPDLVLACHWGPIRVFHNQHGKFVEQTDRLGLARFTGWWNGVAAGDFDGDGKMDLIASNWGRNTKYQTYRDHPTRIYFGEEKNASGFVATEACYELDSKTWLPRCGFQAMTKALPGIIERFSTYQAYGSASVEELFRDQLIQASFLEANWLDSTVFLNRGDHFEAKPLPLEAQFAPAFGLAISDFDGDGFEDVFLSQNFFAIDGETGRYDGGRGLLLKGDGRGGFAPMPGQFSGIQVYGEQRGTAVCDYDADGRADLVVTQNGAATKLYHNAAAKPGLRIRLTGPNGGSPIGAILRLVVKNNMGPAREIHAGSGYWSMDSLVQVMAAPAAAEQIWIRWPGDKTNLLDVPAGAKEIVINADGKIQQSRIFP